MVQLPAVHQSDGGELLASPDHPWQKKSNDDAMERTPVWRTGASWSVGRSGKIAHDGRNVPQNTGAAAGRDSGGLR